MLPLVTIGITAFNAAATIEPALKSALSQTWRPIEIVVVDDCSVDATREILAKIAAGQKEVRVYRNEVNQGVAASRNRILAEARGEFIAYFDDDDESLPERVAAQLTRISDYEGQFANGAPVVCHTARLLVYAGGNQRLASTIGQREGRPSPAGATVAERILMGKSLKFGNGACPTCSQMARSSSYRLVGGFDPSLRRCEDTDFNIRLAMAGTHFVGISRPLVIQYMTKTSEKNLAEEYHNWILLLKKHRALMERAGQYEFCRYWVDAKQAWLESRRLRFARLITSLAFSYPVLTFRRLALAVPNVGLNRAFRFHMGNRS